MAGAPPESEQKPPPAEPPSLAGCWLTAHVESEGGSERDFVQADILDRGPDNRQATVLGREDVDLISALPHIDFPDSQSHWSSEYADACWQGTRKT
jgi:hypothetical protein